MNTSQAFFDAAHQWILLAKRHRRRGETVQVAFLVQEARRYVRLGRTWRNQLEETRLGQKVAAEELNRPMSRRQMIDFVLSGRGSDGDRAFLCWRLYIVHGIRSERREWLRDRGWWAARPRTGDLAF